MDLTECLYPSRLNNLSSEWNETVTLNGVMYAVIDFTPYMYFNSRSFVKIGFFFDTEHGLYFFFSPLLIIHFLWTRQNMTFRKCFSGWSNLKFLFIMVCSYLSSPHQFVPTAK